MEWRTCTCTGPDCLHVPGGSANPGSNLAPTLAVVAAFTAAGLSLIDVVVSARLTRRSKLDEWQRDQLQPSWRGCKFSQTTLWRRGNLPSPGARFW